MILICTRMFPSSIIHKNSKLATIQVSNSMDKLILQLYSNDKEWTAAICNNMCDPHKQYWKKEECVLYDSFYTKFQNRQN